ncbi:MAG: VacJ family lipoprotein [Alphaproteobacteria bacterium]|nr:VacJ family lipoprotein [Alphaproteobacteria bacterium]
MRRTVRFAAFGRATSVVLVAGLLGACAIPPPESDKEAMAEFQAANDPFETANRLVFSFNVAVDNLILQPIAVTYRDLGPEGLKPAIRNLLYNLTLPLTFLHSLLQGNMERADLAAQRFFLNLPTLLLGDVTPAQTEEAKKRIYEDGGQTLQAWGAGSGPYFMLPLLGPSSGTDRLGTVADYFLDLVNAVTEKEVAIGRAVLGAVEERSRNLDMVRDTQAKSVDYYSAVRSLYRQRRAAEISNVESYLRMPAPTIALDNERESAPSEPSSR